ncbi:MAG: hypothetical protein N4A49_07155 [Marinifilaceae bacterium]|jgi:hypothetical protein|nr:hypothetical protein [Marinifilaceae bacterium]
MRWTKLKKEIELRFCDSLKNRLEIFSTRYGNCTCGHAWLVLDKKLIANFCTRAFWNTNPVWDEEMNKFVVGNNDRIDKKTYNNLYNEYGELSRQDVYQSCWMFLHEIPIDEALFSKNPLIQTLAIVDSRIGKRRLRKIDKVELHPLAKKLYLERINKEAVNASFYHNTNPDF